MWQCLLPQDEQLTKESRRSALPLEACFKEDAGMSAEAHEPLLELGYIEQERYRVELACRTIF